MENLTTLSVARIIRRRMNATLEKTYKEAVEACLKEYLDYKNYKKNFYTSVKELESLFR